MSQLGCDPRRLALLARSIATVRDEVELILRLTQIGDLAIPKVHSVLKQSLAVFERQDVRIRRVLNSTFFDISDSYTLKFNSAAFFFTRWVDQHPEWWSDATHGEPTEIDERLSRIAEDPLESGRLIDSTKFLPPLVYGAHDPNIVRSLWLSATDPRTTSAAAAGRRITRLVETVFDGHDWRRGIAPSWVDIHEQKRIHREIRKILGEVIAPWQLHFTGLASEWKWSADDGVGYLKKISESKEAASSLSSGLGSALYRNLSDLPLDDSERLQRIQFIAFAVGASTEILRGAKVRQAQLDSDHLAALLAIPTMLPLKAPWPTSLVLGKITSGLIQQLDTTNDRKVSSAIEQIQQHQALAAIGYMAVFNSALTSGRLESPLDEPPVELKLELQHTVDSLDNAASRGQALAEIHR